MTHPYRCYTELKTQAVAWQQAAENVLAVAERLLRFVAAIQPDQILFLASGSPYYLGTSAAVYWQQILNVPARAVMASEMLLFPGGHLPPAGSRPLLVVVSRSGSTSEVLWALDQFEARFPQRAVLVTCAPGSPLAQRISHQVVLPEGMEQTVPQTRSFSAMYLAVQMLGSVLAHQDEMTDLLTHAHRHFPAELDQWEEQIAAVVADNALRHVFFLGSGPLYGIAIEASLKMSEMSLTEAFAYPFLESRHGPRSLIDDNSLVVGLFGRTAFSYENAVVAELKRDAGARIAALTAEGLPPVTGGDVVLAGAALWPDAVQGLLYLPVVQLLAYYRAITAGVNPDQSRNLVPYVKLDDTGSQTN
jgi:glucosamine--fructose-6-phosphate aminotransferase (isomerizing)